VVAFLQPVEASPVEVAATLPILAAASPDAGVESFTVTVAAIGLATIMAAGIPTSTAAITTGILTTTVLITTTMADATWFVGV
jgi:hypothetical protein